MWRCERMVACVAAALLCFGLTGLVTSPALASMTQGGGASAKADAPSAGPTESIPAADLFAPLSWETSQPSNDIDRFSAAIDPERILRPDFRIAPKLRPVAPAESILANASPTTDPQRLVTPSSAGADPEQSAGGNLAIPLPAIGAGWALLIGAGMYQFGSRVLRLRR